MELTALTSICAGRGGREKKEGLIDIQNQNPISVGTKTFQLINLRLARITRQMRHDKKREKDESIIIGLIIIPCGILCWSLIE